MGWSFKANWPAKPGDEIKYDYFEDIRKLMFAIEEMTRVSEYESPDGWDKNTEYERYQECTYKGKAYTYGYSKSKDMPPPKNGWTLTARRDVYSDYNENSGCFVISDDDGSWKKWKASWELPPQFNKYTQLSETDEDGYHIPLATEKQVEFALRDGYGRDLITGEVGPQYTEYHSFGYPPWYYPYYVLSGVPGASEFGTYKHEYYDCKRMGYQSYVEWFVEIMGDQFYWPLEGAALRDAIEDAQLPYAVLEDWVWGCNHSAFEKCLELIGSYDWFLDTCYCPDPEMNKRYGSAHVIKGCWRKCWKYTFQTPGLGMILWPQEKGTPPFVNEDRNWWEVQENVTKAKNKANSLLTEEEIKTMKERHSPTSIGLSCELYGQMANDMKAVLEQLKWFTVSASVAKYYSNYYWRTIQVGPPWPPLPTSWAAAKNNMKRVTWSEIHSGLPSPYKDPYEHRGWIGSLGAIGDGIKYILEPWAPNEYKIIGYWDRYKTVLTFTGADIENILEKSFHSSMLVVLGLHGISGKNPDDYTNYFGVVTVGEKSMSSEGSPAETEYIWGEYPPLQEGDSLVVEITGDYKGKDVWGPPASCLNHTSGRYSYLGDVLIITVPQSRILIGLDPHKIDLKSVLIE